MAKKDLSKVLKKGSIKQRLKLLDEYRSSSIYGREALTVKEATELIDSFQTPEEIRLYDLHLRAHNYYRHLIAHIEIAYMSYREAIAIIAGFSLVWHTYEMNEEIINSIIREVDNKQMTKLVSEKFSRSQFFYADVAEDEEGFLRFYTDNREQKKRGIKRGDDYSMEGILRIWKAKAEQYALELNMFCNLLLDYSETIDYKPTVFIDKLKHFLEFIKTDHALLPKNSEKQMQENEMANMDLFKKYFVYPNPDNLEIDEEEYGKYLKGMKDNIENG
jgi:hypothetical protein